MREGKGREGTDRKSVRCVETRKIIYSVMLMSMCLFFLGSCRNFKEIEKESRQDNGESSTGTTSFASLPETADLVDLPTVPFEEEAVGPPIDLIVPEGQTIKERFSLPEGYARIVPEAGSFAEYLQDLPLKPDGAKVRYYDGGEKSRKVYLAVVDFTLGERDLQQCADAVIRLRAEYLYEKERYEEIQFHFVSGFLAEFSKWAGGQGISVKGNQVSWYSNSKNTSSYESFQKYLDIVYAYASTLSLEKELEEKSLPELEIGDVFIQGGSPGHCVIVVDAAVQEETGEKIFMLAQSYMPAQDIQILIGDEEGSPWFSDNIEGVLDTPEWRFEITDLKTWKED